MTVIRRAAFRALLVILALAASALAQDVTLSSPDGSVEVSGTLLGFDGQFYRVDSIYGELTVDGSGVSCEGPGCPNLQDFVAEVTFSGSATMGRNLLPALIKGFGRRDGYIIETVELDSLTQAFNLIEAESGRTRGIFFVRSTTTDEGFADLLANEADAVLALREVRQTERDRAREAGMGDLSEAFRSRVSGA